MNFIYTEEFRKNLSHFENPNSVLHIKFIINQCGIVILYMDKIRYEYKILDNYRIKNCKYKVFTVCQNTINRYYTNDNIIAFIYNPLLSLPIYCWRDEITNFLDFQRKVEEVIEGQKFVEFPEYDIRINTQHTGIPSLLLDS